MENTIILSYYDGEDETPTFVYYIDGLKEVKQWNLINKVELV